MDLTPLLDASQASPVFKADARTFARHGAAPSVRTVRHAPPVKVARVLAQLLTAEPALPIEEVTLDAYSGCSDFAGTIEVRAAQTVRRFAFTWCCRWRAEREGWVDCFGFPDQIRAAQEFGWRCFQRWEELPAPEATQTITVGGSAQLSLAR